MFQAVIASDGSHSYILFLYGDLQWSTGDSDGGSGGTGGAPAVAGINAGDGENYFLLPGSGTASVLNLDSDSNIAVDGQFVLSAGNGNAVICNVKVCIFMIPIQFTCSKTLHIWIWLGQSLYHQ